GRWPGRPRRWLRPWHAGAVQAQPAVPHHRTRHRPDGQPAPSQGAATPVPAPAPGPAPVAAGPAAAQGGKFYVFLMPCLNEELVIARSLQRLLSMPADDFAVMVIDDGSDDGTAAAVTGVADERVWLLSRKLPNARQ